MSADSASVLVWREELSALEARLGELFVRAEPRQQAGLYLEGLLSAAKRKNGWQLAEQIGDARPWRTQRVLSHVLWDQDAARDLCRDYVLEHLGAPDGVLIVDETGFLKKGEHSAGVARQYSGTAGRIENVQIGVFLAYASSKGHALIDRELYLPEEWCGDAARRDEAAIPEAVSFATKPALARRMLGRALDAGLPCAWVLGDEIYGSDRRLRMDLERREQPFVLAIRSNEKLWAMLDGHLGQHAASRLAASLPARAWRRLSAGAGSKGERLYDWARLRLTRLQQPPWDHWLLVRRSRKDPQDLAYYVVFGPDRTTLASLAQVAGRRWTIEECFEVAKQEVGLADYELSEAVPRTLAWLVSAHHPRHAGPGLPCRHAGEAQRGHIAQKGAAQSRPLVDLSMDEIRHLISGLQHAAGIMLDHLFDWSLWRRIHQAIAQRCHWKRHQREARLEAQL